MMRINYSFILLCFFSSCIVCPSQNLKTVMSPILIAAYDLGFKHKQDPTQPIPVIAISGCFAVGKSYLSNLLVELLQQEGINTVVIHQDDFLQSTRISNATLHPYLNVSWIHAVLSVLVSQSQKKIVLPTKSGCHTYNKEVDFDGVNLVIFEGVYSLCGSETVDFYKYCNFGIFLQASDKNIWKWHWDREQTKPKCLRRNFSLFKKQTKYNFIDYRSHIEPYKFRASFFIDKTSKNKYQVVQNHLRPA